MRGPESSAVDRALYLFLLCLVTFVRRGRLYIHRIAGIREQHLEHAMGELAVFCSMFLCLVFGFVDGELVKEVGALLFRSWIGGCDER